MGPFSDLGCSVKAPPKVVHKTRQRFGRPKGGAKPRESAQADSSPFHPLPPNLKEAPFAEPLSFQLLKINPHRPGCVLGAAAGGLPITTKPERGSVRGAFFVPVTKDHKTRQRFGRRRRPAGVRIVRRRSESIRIGRDAC